MRTLLPSGSERTRLVGEGLWVATGQAITIVGRLIGIRLLTGVVSPEVYGQVSLLSAASILVAGALVFPVVQATLRFYPDAVRGGHSATLRSWSERYLRVASWVAALGLFVGGAAWWIGTSSGPSAWAYAFLGFGLIADAARTYETGLLNAARRQAAGSLWTAAEACLRPLAAVGFVLASGASAAAVLLGYAGASFTANAAFSRLRVVPTGEESETGAAWRERTTAAVRRYAVPLIPLGLLGWALSLGDRYVLASVAGVEQTGLYAAVYGLGSMPFLALSGVLVTTLRPVLFDAVSRGDRARERAILAGWLALTGLAGALGVALLAFAGPWIVRLLLGPEFRSAGPLLPWIGAAYAVQTVQNVFETRIYARRRTAAFLVLNGASAGVAMALYLVLIPRAGAMGAAIGVLGGMLTSCVVSIFLSRLPEKRIDLEETS